MHRDCFAIQVHSQGELDNLLKTLDSEMTINGYGTFWESWKEDGYKLYKENERYIDSGGGSIVIYYEEDEPYGLIMGWDTIESYNNDDFNKYVLVQAHEIMARFQAVQINISSDNLLEMLG